MLTGTNKQTNKKQAKMYEEWNAEFERVGRKPLEAEALAYFRKELDDQAIRIDTRVFRKKPDNAQLVIFNKMAVKVFLSHNWEYVRELYPCLPSFVNVIGDADLMYTMSYPWTHVDTHEIHGVETVREFVDFAQGIIRQTCVRQAPEPVSSTGLVPLTTTGSLRDAILPEGRRGEIIDPGALRARERAQQSKKELERKHGKYLTVKLDSDRPEIEPFVEGQKALQMHKEKGLEVTDATLWNILSNILKHQGLTVYAELHGGRDNPFEYQWAHEGYKDLDLLPSEKKIVEESVNEMLKRIKEDGTLAHIEGWVKDNSYGKYPSTIRVEGDVGPNGKFSTKTVIYTLGEKVVAVDFKRIFDHLRVRSGEGIDSLWNTDLQINDLFSEEDFNEVRKIVGDQINFSSPNREPGKVSEQAYALVKALFGTGTDFLSEKDITVAVFLDAQSERENPGMATGVEDLFGRLITTKARLRQASVEKKCENLLKRLDVMFQVREEVESGRKELKSCDIEGDEHDNRCLAVEDPSSAEALGQLEDEALTQLQTLFAGSLFGAIDEYAVEFVEGWREFKHARDSESPLDRDNAAAAIVAAKALRQDGVFPDVLFAKLQRVVQHGGSSALGVQNFPNLMRTIGESMPNDNMKDFFYENLPAELLSNHAKEIAGTTMADIDSWCNDVAMLYDVQISRWQKQALHRNEAGLALHTLVYCLAGAVLSLIAHFAFGDGDDKKVFVIWSNLVMLTVEIYNHIPVACVHILLVLIFTVALKPLIIGLRFAGKLPVYLFKLLGKMWKKVEQKVNDMRGNQPLPPDLDDLVGLDPVVEPEPVDPEPRRKGSGGGSRGREARSLQGDTSIASAKPKRATQKPSFFKHG